MHKCIQLMNYSKSLEFILVKTGLFTHFWVPSCDLGFLWKSLPPSSKCEKLYLIFSDFFPDQLPPPPVGKILHVFPRGHACMWYMVMNSRKFWEYELSLTINWAARFFEQILGLHLNLNKIFTQNRYKINMEYVLKQLIVCGVIQTWIFSQEILDKKRIPAGSLQEKNALPYWTFMNT